jgi:hypothetical protein
MRDEPKSAPHPSRRDPDYEAWLIFYGDLHVERSACDLGFALAGSIPAKLDCRILYCFIHP